MTHTAYIAMGSNLGDRRTAIERAIALMDEHRAIRVTARSELRAYPALTHDGSAKPDYLNGVVRIDTELESLELLDALQAIERELGRPAEHGIWESRTIDLDILFYDDLIMDTPRLTLPHPGSTKRMFVLEPLCDIAPQLIHPVTGTTIETLCSELS